mgnify:FL=1
MKPQKMWMLFDPQDRPNYHTLRYCKKDSIAAFFRYEYWSEVRKFGWRCKKVLITATLITKNT